MARDTYFLMKDDIKFASAHELEPRWEHHPPVRRAAIGTISPLDGWVLAAAGGLSMLLIATLAINSMLTPLFSGTATLFLGLAGLGLGLCAVVGAMWVASTSVKGRQSRLALLGLILGGLAIAGGIALPVIEASIRSPVSGYTHKASCERNLALLQLLVDRYERETERPLDRGSSESLRPVWERYRHSHAQAFFCPDSTHAQAILATGKPLSQASFKDISYTGCLFTPSLREHPDLDIGPPLLWEKTQTHEDGIHVYTSNLGPRALSTDALSKTIEAHRELQARHDKQLGSR